MAIFSSLRKIDRCPRYRESLGTINPVSVLYNDSLPNTQNFRPGLNFRVLDFIVTGRERECGVTKGGQREGNNDGAKGPKGSIESVGTGSPTFRVRQFGRPGLLELLLLTGV